MHANKKHKAISSRYSTEQRRKGVKEMKEGKMKITKWTGLLEAIMVASLVALVPIGSAQAEARVEGINETAFWAFVTIALTVVVSVIITSIFHYLSTRELRKMGTEIAVEMGKMGGKVHEGVSEDIKISSNQIQREIAEDGKETRRTIAESGERAIKVIEGSGEETRKVIIELAKSYPAHHSRD